MPCFSLFPTEDLLSYFHFENQQCQFYWWCSNLCILLYTLCLPISFYEFTTCINNLATRVQPFCGELRNSWVYEDDLNAPLISSKTLACALKATKNGKMGLQIYSSSAQIIWWPFYKCLYHYNLLYIILITYLYSLHICTVTCKIIAVFKTTEKKLNPHNSIYFHIQKALGALHIQFQMKTWTKYLKLKMKKKE